MTEWPIKYTLQGGRKSQGNVFRQRKQCRVKTCAVQHLQLYTKHFALQDFNLRQTITQPLDLNWLLLWVTTAHSQNLTFSCSL